jgi:hypothetical protein
MWFMLRNATHYLHQLPVIIEQEVSVVRGKQTWVLALDPLRRGVMCCGIFCVRLALALALKRLFQLVAAIF